MKKLKWLLAVMAVLISLAGYSQSKLYESVTDVRLRSTITITNNKQIVGYGIFYLVDKMKKSAMYRLSILDENLKEIGNNEFEGPKNMELLRGIYESNMLFLAFKDPDKKDGYERFVKVYDLKGKDKGLVSYDPEKVKSGMFGKAIAEQMGNIYDGTDNVEGKGMVTVYQSKAKTGGVDVQMIGTNGKQIWEKNVTAEKGDRTDIYLLGSTPNTLFFCQFDRTGVMAKDGQLFLLGLNADNGKEQFRKPLDIKGWTYDPIMLKKTDDGKVKLISTMLDEGAKYGSATPRGISIADLNDLTGEIKIVKDFTYAGELGNLLNMKTETKSADGYIKPHDLLMMSDGSMVLVGEFFRKTINAAGAAMNMLTQSHSASMAQATIEDMFLLRIDNTLKAKAVEKIEKDKDRVTLPSEGIPIGLMARLLTYQGDWGYMYTDEGMDGQQKTVMARGAFGDEKFGTVAITIDPKKGFSTKRFNLPKEKKTTYYVMRAKPGYVMIMKYNSKEKTLSTNLEKVN